MREYYGSDKKKREDAKRKKREEKRNKRLNKKSEVSSEAGTVPSPNLTESPSSPDSGE